MSNEVEIFKPGLATLKELAEKYKGLQINGVEDENGYKLVKDARKELGDMRIMITKFGKSKREEALAFQREVLRQEREHLEIITPLEGELKAKIEAVDKAKAKEERKILLPTRKAMLSEIGSEMTDDEILDLDEKQFQQIYTEKQMSYFQAKDAERKAEEAEKRHAEELEQAKAEAAEKATLEAEKKAQEQIDNIKREQEAKEQADINKKKAEEDALMEKEALEKALQEKAEKNRRYKAWAKQFDNVDDVEIKREGNTFRAYKKIGEITIN